MEIKGIGGVINTYKTTKAQAPKKTSAAVSAKKTDRVEFGFDKALGAAKAAIANEVAANATAEELASAQTALESGLTAAELAQYFFM